MTIGNYTFTEGEANNLPAVTVTAKSGCVLGTWYMPARCKSLEDFAVRFLDPFSVITRIEDKAQDIREIELLGA